MAFLLSRKADVERWLEEYSGPLVRLCYFYLQDYHLAQDAVQETFFRAYSKYGLFRGQSSEKTWLTAIAVNVCKNLLRQSMRREIPAPMLLCFADPSGPQSEDDEAADLLRAVYSLPSDMRQVILLRYYQDLPVKDIARILRLKPDTVSARLNRARGRLETVLRGEEPACGGRGKEEGQHETD